MRNPLSALLLMLCLAVPLQAADDVAVESIEKQPVQLGGGVVLPREVFDQIMAREDGLKMIERMQQRAEESRQFEGMPHLILIFAAVLVFFWSSMVYYQRKHARLHRTMQLMIEKGLPLPVEILRAAENLETGMDPPRAQSAGAGPAPFWASNLLWGGILWITVGVTGMLYLYFRGSDAWPWGIAAIIYGLGAVATASKNKNAAR